jgi:hypothetical protein
VDPRKRDRLELLANLDLDEHAINGSGMVELQHIPDL